MKRQLSLSRCAWSPFAGLLVGLAGTGCDPQPETRPETEHCEKADNAQLGTRFVAIKLDPADSCEATLGGGVSNWTARPLFPPTEGQGDVPAALAKYCVYEHASAAAVVKEKEGRAIAPIACAPAAARATPADVATLHAALSMTATSISEDTVIVSAQTPADVTPADVAAIRHHLRIQMARETGTLTANIAPHKDKQGVHRAVAAILDSAPQAVVAPAFGTGELSSNELRDLLSPPAPAFDDVNDAHGPLMAFLANDRACPSSNADALDDTCGVRTRTVLALPLQAADEYNAEYGGHFGARSHVAIALYQTVLSWRARFLATNGEEARLAIGLSLGWEPQPDRDAMSQVCASNPDPMTGIDSASQAVQDALSFAACHGVTVVAAAGNAAGGTPSPSGLLCPARYEAVPIPPSDQCAGFTEYTSGKTKIDFRDAYQGVLGWALDRPHNPALAPYQPLVYAAGGIDFNGHKLVPTRPSAVPRFALPAMGGVALNDSLRARGIDDLAWSEAPRTGTSVAAANLTGMLAALLAREPSLTPPEAMRRFHDTGTPLLQQGFGALGAPSAQASPGAGLLGSWNREVRKPMLCSALYLPCPGWTSKPVSQAIGHFHQSFSAGPGTTTQAPDPFLLQTSSQAEPWVIKQPILGSCPDCLWSDANDTMYIVNPAWRDDAQAIVVVTEVDASGNATPSSYQIAYDAPRASLATSTVRVHVSVQYGNGIVDAGEIVAVP